MTPGAQASPLALTLKRWIFEMYRMMMGTLQSKARMLLACFTFALMAYVIARGLEFREQAKIR